MFEGLLQPSHLIIILIVALLALGPKRLPEVGRSLGTGLRSFRESLAEDPDGRRPSELEHDERTPR